MKYWARIKLNDLEAIQAKTIQYLKTNREKFPKGTPFNPLPLVEFMQAVPELETSFAEHGLTINFISAYIMWNNYDGGMHRDSSVDVARVNIPIINCEDSWTNFYVTKVPGEEPLIVLNSKGMPYRPYKPDDVVLVDRVQITEPTIIRPLEIHGIEIDETKVPRVTLTIATDPMPDFLLEETSP
jgi:hypothetical protein